MGRVSALGREREGGRFGIARAKSMVSNCDIFDAPQAVAKYTRLDSAMTFDI